MSCVADLVAAFKGLPGIGFRSARRIAYHLLQQDRAAAQRISLALSRALEKVGLCPGCNGLAELESCAVCKASGRDRTKLCVVTSSADMSVIEQTGVYKGLYFVLSCCISPLDGEGPRQACFDKLMMRLTDPQLEELILATSFTTEGEATAFFVTKALLGRGVTISRIARGLPAGSDIEYADPVAVGQAVIDRVNVYSTSQKSGAEV